MSNDANPEPRQRRVLWRREVDDAFDDTSIQLISEKTGIEMPWYFDHDEWVVGYKELEKADRGNAFIEAVRLGDRAGVAFELVSSIPNDTAARYRGELEGVEKTLAAIGAVTRVDPPDAVVLSPDDVPSSVDAEQQAAIEALQQFVYTIEEATGQFADSSQRQAIVGVAFNVIDELATTQAALLQTARQTTSEPPPVPETLVGDAEGTLSPGEPEPEPPPHTYTVASGDTLWAIAERFYGDLSKYRDIADASGISFPEPIQPGQQLTLP
jgi:nucleoid-associated protein YgaU